VPCERVFSSSKETCTSRRSRLSPKTIEMLQVLKFIYRHSSLNFTSQLLANTCDYEIEGPVTAYAVQELRESGKMDELADLLQNAADSE
ncbi:hypothetical protein PUNSTDRAFT_72132, partial [Punctularia strigosozonata HHB-11173 SS5]|uniref:uncharacterized protein n=1 Tax=Punctularia strigosozonata (strain HHB-11173) TaxID=741275 RepID=UPI0004416894